MAFTLTLPLVGLEPRNFSALSTRLQCEIMEYPSPSVSEQNSPNTTNDFNETGGGNYPAVFGSTRDEKTSQQSSKSSSSVESERQRKEKGSQQPRVMYQGRDVLNLGANIRDPVWKTRDMWNGAFDSATPNRSIAQRLHEQTRTEDQRTKSCSDCRFRQPKPYLY